MVRGETMGGGGMYGKGWDYEGGMCGTGCDHEGSTGLPGCGMEKIERKKEEPTLL